MRAVLPAMRAQRDGLVINISSWAGVHHPKMTGAAYNGSKHAVVALTEKPRSRRATPTTRRKSASLTASRTRGASCASGSIRVLRNHP